jgi:uracil-DNA glycosylase family 4
MRLIKIMDKKILAIFSEAKSCTRCYGDTPLHVPLPDERNGGIGATVLFLVERPGRVGTGKSGRVSFENKDPTAEFFRELFFSIGVDRRNIFITNVVLCHPITPEYKDAPVSTKELRNCLYFLEKQIKTIDPVLIVTLGTKALQAMKYLYSHRATLRGFHLKENIGDVITGELPFIYPLYHTSLRARLTRPANKQRQDWSKIPEILKRLGGI